MSTRIKKQQIIITIRCIYHLKDSCSQHAEELDHVQFLHNIKIEDYFFPKQYLRDARLMLHYNLTMHVPNQLL